MEGERHNSYEGVASLITARALITGAHVIQSKLIVGVYIVHIKLINGAHTAQSKLIISANKYCAYNWLEEPPYQIAEAWP